MVARPVVTNPNIEACQFMMSLAPVRRDDFVDSRHLPKPIHPLSIWGASLLLPLIPTSLSVVFSSDPSISCLVVYVSMGLLVHALVRGIALRRAAHLHRYEVLAECNHHIRNALQSLVSVGYVHGHEEIKAAADRIEAILREVLPHVNDEFEN